MQARFQFILTTLKQIHDLKPEQRYTASKNIADNNDFGMSYDELHALFIASERAIGKYFISYDQAIMYAVLKDAVYKEFVLDEHGCKSTLNLLDYSDLFTKDVLIKLATRVGMSEEQVSQVLPTFAYKMAKCEAKFIVSSSKARLFANVTEFNNAFDEVKGKYETRYEL